MKTWLYRASNLKSTITFLSQQPMTLSALSYEKCLIKIKRRGCRLTKVFSISKLYYFIQ